MPAILERLWKKRLKVNLSPKEKLEELFKYPNFQEEFEVHDYDYKQDKMEERPYKVLILSDTKEEVKKQNVYFHNKELLLLKSDYDVRVRFFTSSLYHIAYTCEEQVIIKQAIELSNTNNDFWHYRMQTFHVSKFPYWIQDNSYYLNEILKLKEQIKNWEAMDSTAYSYISGSKTPEEIFEEEDKKKAYEEFNQDKQLYNKIINIINNKLFFKNCTYKCVLEILKHFELVKNFSFEKANEKELLKLIQNLGNYSDKIYYCVDYKNRILHPRDMKDDVIQTSHYFLEVKTGGNNYLLPFLEEKFKEYFYIIKASHDFKLYSLFCEKALHDNGSNKFQNIIDIIEGNKEFILYDNLYDCEDWQCPDCKENYRKYIIREKHFSYSYLLLIHFMYINTVFIFETIEEQKTLKEL